MWQHNHLPSQWTLNNGSCQLSPHGQHDHLSSRRTLNNGSCPLQVSIENAKAKFSDRIHKIRSQINKWLVGSSKGVEVDRGAGVEVDRGAGVEVDRGAGVEVDQGAGVEVDRGAGVEAAQGAKGVEVAQGAGGEAARGAEEVEMAHNVSENTEVVHGASEISSESRLRIPLSSDLQGRVLSLIPPGSHGYPAHNTRFRKNKIRFRTNKFSFHNSYNHNVKPLKLTCSFASVPTISY